VVVVLVIQNESFRAEIDSLRLKLQSSAEETTMLRRSLDESRATGDRLHQENDVAIQNIDQWLREQKFVYFKFVSFLIVFFSFVALKLFCWVTGGASGLKEVLFQWRLCILRHHG